MQVSELNTEVARPECHRNIPVANKRDSCVLQICRPEYDLVTPLGMGCWEEWNIKPLQIKYTTSVLSTFCFTKIRHVRY